MLSSFSCICSHSSIEWDQRTQLSSGGVFSWSIKLTKLLPTHIPTSLRDTRSRWPIPKGLLFLFLWSYSLRLLTIAHSALGNMGIPHDHLLMPLCLLARLHVQLYSTFATLTYYYYCFYCKHILSLLATLWEKAGCASGAKCGFLPWKSFLAPPGWVTMLLLYVPMTSYSFSHVISLNLYFNHLFTWLFSSLNSKHRVQRQNIFLSIPCAWCISHSINIPMNELKSQLNPWPPTIKCKSLPNCVISFKRKETLNSFSVIRRKEQEHFCLWRINSILMTKVLNITMRSMLIFITFKLTN